MIHLANKKLVRALLSSALIHVFTALLLMINLIRPVKYPSSVAVEYREVTPTAARTKPARGSRAKARGLPLAKLVPKLKLDHTIQQDWTADTEEETSPAANGPLSMAHSNYIGYLWRTIDRHIEENQFLSEYNHTGKVELRFDVDGEGQLVPGSLSATAADRVLKVIAARAVRRGLRNDTGHSQRPPSRMRIHARFHWSSYQACNYLRGHSGRELSFCHYAENKRKTFSGGERTATWLSSIVQHGPWAYEEIQKYNREERRRKAQFNPFRMYELDPDWNL